MRFALVHEGRPWRKEAMAALAAGLSHHGHQGDVRNDWRIDPEAYDCLVAWGERCPHDHPLRLYLEAGYVNGTSGDYHKDRLRFVSTSWNGLHGHSDPPGRDFPADRWLALRMPLKPWYQGPGGVLVCDQHPGDAVAPEDAHWWRLFEERFGQVEVRPHPLIRPGQAPLAVALKSARYCVTWSSSSAVQSVVAGVPTWALDRGSIAWEVCAHSVDDGPAIVPRARWAYNLAYRQWTLAELASGEAWENIGRTS